MRDEIQVHGLRVTTRIGVTEEERSGEQHLVVNLKMVPREGFGGIGDDVENTTDYEEVAEQVRALCARGERRLVETLAEEIAELLLGKHALASVEVEMRKFILPECEYVGVRIVRGGDAAAPE